jgi:hypothetical protein
LELSFPPEDKYQPSFGGKNMKRERKIKEKL